MNKQEATAAVEQMLEGVELYDDTLYAVVANTACGSVMAQAVWFAFGQKDLRQMLAWRLPVPMEGSENVLRVMPISRTVLAEWRTGE